MWNEKGQLSFNGGGNVGSAISETGNIQIPVETLDNLVGNEDVNLIKMDIEGAELNALKGAYKIITEQHPVLVVCAYHKREDLITLPQFIKSLNGGYKLYLRKHDCSSLYDLVLYAIP